MPASVPQTTTMTCQFKAKNLTNSLTNFCTIRSPQALRVKLNNPNIAGSTYANKNFPSIKKAQPLQDRALFFL